MRALLSSLFLLIATPAFAEPETWLLTIDRWGNPEYAEAAIETEGDVLTGQLGSWSLAGLRDGDRVSFTATDADGEVYRFSGLAADDRMSGSADYPDINVAEERAVHGFTARRLNLPGGDGPARVVFEPQSYSNAFTAHR